MRISALMFLGGLLVAGPALAGDTASTPLPDEPTVDFSTVPASASVRPDNLNGAPHQAYAQLLADRTVVKSGEPFKLGVRLVPDDNWHSYWKSPGDVGMPLEITWSLPDGTKTTTIEFPVPQRFDSSGIISYGYDGPVMLFTEVTLPAPESG